MLKTLTKITWPPVTRPNILKTKMLCLINAGWVNNIDIIVAGNIAKDVTDDIRE